MTADTNEALDALVKRLESHMGKADMQDVLKDCRQAADMLTAQAAKLAEAEADADRLAEALGSMADACNCGLGDEALAAHQKRRGG